MSRIYFLRHIATDVYQDKGELVEYGDKKKIGLFSSREEAEETLEKYKQLKGFRNFPDSFQIEEYFIDSIYNRSVNNLISEMHLNKNSYKEVWTLYYYKEHFDGAEDVELLGIFSSEEKAEEAKKHLLIVLDLQDEPDLLSIYEDDIGSLGWEEGFFIVQ